MTYDFILAFDGGPERAGFSIVAADRDDAELELVRRLLGAGWSARSLLHWSILSVTEVRGRR